MDQDATWYGGRPRSKPHCVRWRPSFPAKRGTAAPTFRPMSILAKWLDGSFKMLLGTEVGLSPGYNVLYWDPAPPEKGHSSHPHFSVHVYCGQMAGCIKMPVGTEVGLSPGNIVLDGDLAPPTERGTAAPTFRPMRNGTE